MPSATLTIHPSDKSESDSSFFTSLVPSIPSRDTALKGAAVVVGIGACYLAYRSASNWLENMFWKDLFCEKEEDAK